jgi:hypothetical protein
VNQWLAFHASSFDGYFRDKPPSASEENDVKLPKFLSFRLVLIASLVVGLLGYVSITGSGGPFWLMIRPRQPSRKWNRNPHLSRLRPRWPGRK